MASYQYDPQAGEARAVGINSQSGTEESNGPTVEEITAHRVEQTAVNLTKRQTDQNTPGDTGNYASEGDLYEAQRDLEAASRAGNHLRVAELEEKVYAMAAALTGSPFKEPAPVEQQQESTADELRAAHGEQSINETLTWAAETLSESVSTALNDELAKDDEGAAVVYSAIDQVRRNPQYLAEQGQVTSFSLDQANELSSQFGSHGESLAAINHGLATGRCTRAQAAQLVMGDPQLAAVAIQAASQGLIQLAL